MASNKLFRIFISALPLVCVVSLRIEPKEQTQSSRDSAVELRQQMDVVADAAADERKQMEKYINMQEQEIQLVVFNRIYERNTNWMVWIDILSWKMNIC